MVKAIGSRECDKSSAIEALVTAGATNAVFIVTLVEL
jgi:hypothetical protein